MSPLDSQHSAPSQGEPKASRLYAWLVFALTFGLMLSDYMSRQVINAVFPVLKSDWGLSDTELGALVSVVALTVGLMTFPLSLVADRWGRVRSATTMAIVWGLATIACGMSNNFAGMLVARMVVGLGEAVTKRTLSPVRLMTMNIVPCPEVYASRRVENHLSFALDFAQRFSHRCNQVASVFMKVVIQIALAKIAQLVVGDGQSGLGKAFLDQ